MQAIIKLGTAALNVLYFFIKLLPVKNKVVMISRQSNTPSIDFILLKKALQQQDASVDVVFLCHTLDGGLKSSYKDKIKYAFHMLKQMKEIASSKVIVLDTYCIVISLLKHRRSLKIIQMWHSIGTMKKFGYTALDTAEGTSTKIAKAMRMHEQYSYVFASSPAYQADLAKGFHCPEDIVRIYPLPRVDILTDASYKQEMRKKLYQKYPILKEKQVILYVPTFRKKETMMQTYVDKLCDALYDDQILVVKRHPLSKLTIHNPHVLVDTSFTSFDMLFVADAVISDYSCIIYEAALLNIPLYFYNFDMQNYTGKRGLAIDYENELPGVISKDPKVIIDSIEKEPYDMDELQRFCKKYVVYDGNTSLHIADFILNLMKEGNDAHE
ncbi:MAG: CDP-glycerol glycerophosphotransferase family protein [Longicatena caecimuris]|uniref:CDP-glycerol glycerophosphotransferase family protein n=1 Tax=Longicatena caecimuris TaxID=1796635 RepID=UPI0039996A99